MSFKHIVNGSSVPAFPGAYIFNGDFTSGVGAVAVPIYGSNSHSAPATVDNRIINDKDKYVYVLPGYKIEIYQHPDYDVNHQYALTYPTPAYTVDNTNGTEILFQKSVIQNIVNSYKLYFKDVLL